MSGGPLYDIVRHDSQNAAHLGNMIGGSIGNAIENEGKYNTRNPGHAITKAAETFAAMYGAAALAGGGGAAGAAGGAGSGAASGAAAAADEITAQQLAQMAAQQGVDAAGSYMAPLATQSQAALSGANAINSLPQLGGISPEAAMGQGGMGVAQNGIGPGALGSQFQGAMNNPSSLLSSQGLPANMARGLLQPSAAGPQGANKMQLMQMGNNMMNPQPQQPMMAPQGRPVPQGQQQPLPQLYDSPFGPGGNSLGIGQGNGLPQSLTPEMLARLRAQGLLV